MERYYYSIQRECWNDKTYNGYTDNPYWLIISEGGYRYGLTDNGEAWGIGDSLITSHVRRMIETVINECKLNIKLI
jgi:hypothetical protein